MADNINLVNSLIAVLADSQILSLKTQNYHWNVSGINFKTLHSLFEEQYNELNEAIDEIAELIRSLGKKAPASWNEYSQLSSLSEGDSNLGALAMVEELANDQLKISDIIKSALRSAEEIKDEVAIDLMVNRLSVHRKNHWMLSSIIN